MAYSQADLDVLKAAVASGVLRVRFEDREVVYRDMKELLTAIQVVEDAMAVTSGTKKQSLSYASFSKGFR